MALQTVTLQIPEYIYERARQVAETTDKPIETVLVEQLAETTLPPLPADEEAELNALSLLSDDTLWTIAREQMPSIRQERMEVLMTMNSKGTLSEAEAQELAHLVELGQKLMLRKGKAAALLTERGHKVTRQLLRG